MATTDLKLDEQGTLPRPGPIGRLVRLALGLFCLYYVYILWVVRDVLILADGSIRPLLWNGIVVGLILISYIVNIGFSRSWKKSNIESDVSSVRKKIKFRTQKYFTTQHCVSVEH